MLRSSPSLREHADDPSTRTAAGIWSLDGDRLVSIESFDIGPAIVLVPSEQVLLTIAALPIASAQRRAEALPFAIEDQIAEPLAAVHAALGTALGPQAYLAGIVSHAAMQGWVDRLAEAGLGRAAIVPDALALPVPAIGGWSVDLADGRAMVRTADGAGFAIAGSHLEQAWTAAGRPACVLYGAPLAFAPNSPLADLAAAPLAARLTMPALDLRQGAYARPRRALPKVWRRIAIAAGIGLAAHGAIAAADTLALDRLAQRRASETRALAAQVAPGVTLGDDLPIALADILPAAGSGPSPFLPLLGRISAAVQPLGTAATLRTLAFDAAAGSFALDVEASDIATLQRVGAALQGAGLSAQAGAASTDQGKAVGSFLVRSSAR